MSAILLLVNFLSLIIGIGWLICFILVLVKMFQNDQVVMGVVCIVLIFCGIGPLVAFVYGWIKSSEWNIQKLMLIWTGCFIGNLLLGAMILVIGLTMAPNMMEMQQQMQQEMLRDFPPQ